MSLLHFARRVSLDSCEKGNSQLLPHYMTTLHSSASQATDITVALSS
jgi:hypothetical protein